MTRAIGWMVSTPQNKDVAGWLDVLPGCIFNLILGSMPTSLAEIYQKKMDE